MLIEAHCVDQYIATQTHTQDDLPPKLKDADVVMHDKDPRLESVVERMFDRCIKDKEYKQVHPLSSYTNCRLLELLSKPDDLIPLFEYSKQARIPVY